MDIQLTGQRLRSREHIEKVTRQMFGALERNRNTRIEKLIEWTDAGSMSLPAVAVNPVRFGGTFYGLAEHSEAVRLELEQGSRAHDATLVERGRVAHEAALKAIEPHVVTHTVHPESAWTWPEGMTTHEERNDVDRLFDELDDACFDDIPSNWVAFDVDPTWTWPEGMTAGDIMASATPAIDVLPLKKGDVIAMIFDGQACIGDVTDGMFVRYRDRGSSSWIGARLSADDLMQTRLVHRRETVESAPFAPEEGPDILAHSDGVDPLGRAIERPAVDAPRFGYGGESVAMGWSAYE